MVRIPSIELDEEQPLDRDLLQTSMPPESLNESYRHLISRPERNVHLTIGHNQAIIETFRNTNAEVYDACGLSKREREIVILTVASESESRYEWHQHVRHAMAAGFTCEEIHTLDEGETETFTDAEAALHRYVPAFVRETVDDSTYEELADYFNIETSGWNRYTRLEVCRTREGAKGSRHRDRRTIRRVGT